MYHLSSGESSKPQYPQKARLLGEFEDAKRSLAHTDEEMRQVVERMLQLEETQERITRERKRKLGALQGFMGTIGVKQKTKIGECTILKKGAINTNHRRLLFLL